MWVDTEAGECDVMQEKLLSEMTRDHEQMISEHAAEREDMISKYTAERDQLNADIASTLRDRDDRLTKAEHDKQQVQFYDTLTNAKLLILVTALVTSAPSVAVFWSRLKTHLFNISYPSPLW